MGVTAVQEPFDVVEKCSYQLGTTAPSELLATVQYVLKPLSRQCSEGNRIVYELPEQCDRIDPGVVLLFQFANEQLSRRRCTVYIRGFGEPITELAEHFKHHWQKKQGLSTSSVERTQKGIYLLRDIQDPSSMVGELEEWAESVRQGAGATAEQVALWQMQISEITTNSFQHGYVYKDREDCPASIVAGKVEGDHVYLAALDYGSTIPRTIKNVADCAGINNNDGERIRFACRKGVTSRSVRQNQGAGLYSLVETVKDCGGSLLILSRNGLAHVCGKRLYSRNLDSNGSSMWLDGTLTVINLKLG